MISLVYETKDEIITLDTMVVSINWSGDITQPYRTLSVQLKNTLNLREKAVDLENGNIITFRKNKQVLFKGILFNHQIDQTGNHSLTCYDLNYYLTKNTTTKKITNKTASQFIRNLCEEFDIPYNQIDETGYVIPKRILKSKTLYDMIKIVLTDTYKQTGRRFFILNKDGKLDIIERGTQISEWVLEEGVNIRQASYRKSIEDMKTRIKVTAGEETNPIIATVEDKRLIEKYGLMQHLEEADTETNKSQAEQLAKTLLNQLGTFSDEAEIEALGIVDVYAGKSIRIKESMTGLRGSYYVDTDAHTFSGSTHTMRLTLAKTLPLTDEELL